MDGKLTKEGHEQVIQYIYYLFKTFKHEKI